MSGSTGMIAKFGRREPRVAWRSVLVGVALSLALGIPNARLIAPGNSNASLIVERMQRRDVHGMPPLGSNVVDTLNVARITAWIDSLSGCN